MMRHENYTTTTTGWRVCKDVQCEQSYFVLFIYHIMSREWTMFTEEEEHKQEKLSKQEVEKGFLWGRKKNLRFRHIAGWVFFLFTRPQKNIDNSFTFHPSSRCTLNCTEKTHWTLNTIVKDSYISYFTFYFVVFRFTNVDRHCDKSVGWMKFVGLTALEYSLEKQK